MAIVRTAQAALESLLLQKPETKSAAEPAAIQPMDDQSFQTFHHGTSAGLRAYVFRVTGNASQTDDIVQESYLRIMRAPPATEDPQHLRAFLFRVASNLIVDQWRIRKREDGLSAPGMLPSPTIKADNIPLRLDMERLFERLNPRERQMMWLAHVEGFGHREIAEAMGLRERSVKVLLHRTRTRLARMIREERKDN